MYLFDFDGTLVDSNGVWVEIDNGFLARRGLTPTREYSDTVGHSIFPIAAQFTKDYYCLDMTPEAIMAEWLDMARDAYARQVPMKPGAEAFLARCAAAGDCTLFEDSPGACRAAQAVGIRAVGVFDPFYASYEAEMRGFCDRYITSFTELL